MLPRVDIEAAVALAHVVAHKSFRAAASRLGIPRSTLSERVQRLERQLGVQLLVRSTRSVRLTDLGQRYLDQALPALERLHLAELAITDARERPSGRLRLTAPVELGQALLPMLLTAYFERYPDVTLEVELTDRVVNLIAEGFDLAIRVGPLQSSSLTARRLGKLPPLRTLASPGYLARRGIPVRPEQLIEHDCLAMGSSQQPRLWRYVVGGRRRSIAIEPRIVVNSFGVLRELVAAGCGIARLPVTSTSDQQQSPLQEVLAEFRPRPAPCFAVFSGGSNQSAAVRKFIDLLEERFPKGRSCDEVDNGVEARRGRG